jgi:hypothetical protein
MKKYIRAEIQNMGKDEILTMIPQDTLDRIKQTDKRPEFKVFCVGHEGVARAGEISFGMRAAKAFQYVKDMIVRIVDRLKFGTPIFNQHVETNSHIGREQIGELVGKAVRTIGDKVSALAAMYIYPQYRKMDLDVASIEANIEYIPKGKTGGDVVDVEDITGIALSSSKIDKPAFPGATLLGIVQAFAKTGGKEEGKMEKQEIIDAIKEGGFKVADIFGADEIMASEPAKKAKQTEYEHAKRIEKQLGEEREKVIDFTKKLDESQGKIKRLNEAVSGTHTKTLFEKVCETRKFNDKEKAYIAKKLDGFKSEKEGDELKTDFDRFIDTQKTDFDETVKLLGADPGKPGTGAAAGAGAGAGAGAAGGGSDDGKGGGADLTDPKNNDYIPQ